MADINTLLYKIRSAVYGRDVRQSIHDAIRKCYEDGRAGSHLIAKSEYIGVSSWDDLLPACKTLITNLAPGQVKVFVIQVGDPSGEHGPGENVLCTIHKGQSPALGVTGSTVEILRSWNGCKLRLYGCQNFPSAEDPTLGTILDEWEWENPPMNLGVEYRTTEQHNGKPVYTMLVSGKGPGARGMSLLFYDEGTYLDVTDGIITRHPYTPIRCEAYYVDGVCTHTLPEFNGWVAPDDLSGLPSDVITDAFRAEASGNGAVYVRSTTDRSECTCYARVWYVKN